MPKFGYEDAEDESVYESGPILSSWVCSFVAAGESAGFDRNWTQRCLLRKREHESIGPHGIAERFVPIGRFKSFPGREAAQLCCLVR
jgi:hypothetical protein